MSSENELNNETTSCDDKEHTDFLPTLFLDSATERMILTGKFLPKRGQWVSREVRKGKFDIIRRQKGRFIGVYNQTNKSTGQSKPTIFASWHHPGEQLQDWNKRFITACEKVDREPHKHIFDNVPVKNKPVTELGYDKDYTENVLFAQKTTAPISEELKLVDTNPLGYYYSTKSNSPGYMVWSVSNDITSFVPDMGVTNSENLMNSISCDCFWCRFLKNIRKFFGRK